jgi:GNAT superfamily N-acetyltransferase
MLLKPNARCARVLEKKLTIRELAAEEFPLLGNVHEGLIPDPLQSVAIVAEKDGEILGRVFLMQPVHVEGPWVREDHRGGTIGKRLMDQAELSAFTRGIKTVFAYAADAHLAGYLERLGYKKSELMVFTKDLT